LPETITRPDIKQDVERRQHLLPPYAVLLHNDDVHAMIEVVQALRRSVPGLSAIKAARIMLEAHNSGMAVVMVVGGLVAGVFGRETRGEKFA